MDGRRDIYETGFVEIDRIDGGLCGMHIPPLFCAVTCVKDIELQIRILDICRIVSCPEESDGEIYIVLGPIV